MNPATDPLSPLIETVLHPTDFSDASTAAFHHALKAALVAKSRLTLLHVHAEGGHEAMDFPAVRETLERWGQIPVDSPRSAVTQLGIEVRKVALHRDKPVHAILDYLEERPTDLLVLAAHKHETWITGSVAPAIACRAGQMALFIPEDGASFVSATDGSVSLNSILIPVAGDPPPQPALEAAARLVRSLRCPNGTFTVLHVGHDKFPEVHVPAVPGWEWKQVMRQDEVIHGIVETAYDAAANLVVMSTDGRNGLVQALRGSHAELILRQPPAPLLIVPVGSLADIRLEHQTR